MTSRAGESLIAFEETDMRRPRFADYFGAGQDILSTELDPRPNGIQALKGRI
jgi:hypothetical protein